MRATRGLPLNESRGAINKLCLQGLLIFFRAVCGRSDREVTTDSTFCPCGHHGL